MQVTDSQKPITINNETNQFKISLNATPGTGYSWRLKRYDSSLIVPVSKIYQPPQNVTAGKSGVETFTFIVNKNATDKKRTSHITFVYVRPWSKDIAQTMTYRIVVKGSCNSTFSIWRQDCH